MKTQIHWTAHCLAAITVMSSLVPLLALGVALWRGRFAEAWDNLARWFDQQLS